MTKAPEMEKAVEAACRALALEHYAKRFGADPESAHVQMNVDANAHTFGPDVRIALTAALPHLLSLSDTRDEIARLREALEPFAEIARRLGWATLEEDAPELIEHVLEAPADDLKPGAVCVLHVSCFAEAARVLALPATPAGAGHPPHIFSCRNEKCPLGGMKLTVIDVEPASLVADQRHTYSDREGNIRRAGDGGIDDPFLSSHGPVADQVTKP